MPLSRLVPALLLASAGLLAFFPAPTESLPRPLTDTTQRPEENRFVKTVLSNDLNEPMELAVTPAGRVYFVERAGKLYLYDPARRNTRLLHDFPVKAVDKYLNGMLGMTIDPHFNHKPYLYFFYTIQEGEATRQRISRFRVLEDGMIDLASEKSIIEFPIDLEVSAHTGGSMAWDARGNLFISTGDNTVPFESGGYAPIDQQPGRLTFDAERSAGNPNDLRGKILRIHVEDDGSYTIPEGNLFAKGTPGTRPEIYVMGCRNPYRISVDTATSTLYWGEIGPDAGTDGPQGPRGYDELNQARTPGNYGWPYFVGNNKPYHQYDFATKTVGPLFDPQAPLNTSPLNTGTGRLPAARPAMVWYPYAKSDEFPQLGMGGRCAMGGPVYHFSEQLKSDTKLPAYYDGAVFFYDWMRNWIFAVRLDQQQHYEFMEPFMQKTGDFRRPVDMEIGPEGSVYLLEYGSVYGIDNVDARLVRIDYNGGNRAPIARADAPDSIGTAPLKVAFSASRSEDYDHDDLKYEWFVAGKKLASSEKTLNYTFLKNGIYRPVLRVTDPSGLSATDTLTIRVGNTLPQVSIRTPQNSTFFFAEKMPLRYEVQVADKEDKTIDTRRLKVTLTYLPKVGNEPLTGHQQLTSKFDLGRNLMAASDCKACHQLNAKSVGPSFTAVSRRYADDPNAPAKLANKIIVGGGGVWGQHAMSAHPQLSREEATEMVHYILSVGRQTAENRLPQRGTAQLSEHVGQPGTGRYLLRASYTDGGGAIRPLTSSTVLMLRPSRIAGREADKLHNVSRQDNRLGSIHDGSWFMLKNIDLQGISGITFRYASKDQAATLEIRADGPDGPLLGSTAYRATGKWDAFQEITVPLGQLPQGLHDVYFVFVKKEKPSQHLFSLDWLEFKAKK